MRATNTQGVIMKETPPLGMNRTGMQMSPLEGSAMQTAVPPLDDPTTGDDSAVSAMRNIYITDADPIGSVPLPATVTGAVTTGMSMLAGNSPQIFLDKLGERLAFERTGTRMYDALITKFEAMDEGTTSMELSALQKLRADESRHFAIVADAIESMGGDPTAQTPCADLAGMESLGLIQVLTDPRTTLAQSLHAILVAELSDNVGWEMLVALADDNQQAALSAEFSIALSQERDHLQMVKQWYREALLGRSYVADNRQAESDSEASRKH
jgi:rubrerythrin